MGREDPLGRGRRGRRRVRDRLLERRSPRGLGAATERPCRAARARRAGRLGAGCPRRTGRRARRRGSGRRRTEAGRPATAAPRAPDRPRRPRAVRRLAGPARPAPDGVRRSALRDARRLGARRAVLHPARGAPGSPLALEPRQLRRRVLRRVRRARRRSRARREGALRRRLPALAEAHAARSPGDPARDRVRRPDHRRRRAHAAETRAEEARGDVRTLRSRGHAGADATPRRRSPSSRC